MASTAHFGRLLALSMLMLIIAISNNGILQFSNAQTICNVPISGLMACKPAVTPPNPTPPSTVCCSALTHANMRCLCSYRNSTLLPTLGIDPNLAVQLPEKCKFPHPAHC
ncbi:Bifunctional inhibitor/plant lipid transfer protein/seed storage helical domain containing protein [Quillaja saponaria]|uniref:Bifunctional inhibitor/plant lipid transfer protein/seed storage helical domain containing protein n=1 Tax=Quillaja saponaria TaxID=32244 RepID=A0AAD7VKG7_QUISA|nr:Bifunctional inhibitor/plant lipid transfer protein/seed storage helical domain containing protein [Quillaja saponaria]